MRESAYPIGDRGLVESLIAELGGAFRAPEQRIRADTAWIATEPRRSRDGS